MRSAGNFSPEWGYLAPAPSFARTARVVLVATAIGATAGAGVVLSLVDRPSEPENTPVAARAIVTSVRAAAVPSVAPAAPARQRAGNMTAPAKPASPPASVAVAPPSGKPDISARASSRTMPQTQPAIPPAANAAAPTLRLQLRCPQTLRRQTLRRPAAGSQRDHARPAATYGRYGRGRDRGRSGNRLSFGKQRQSRRKSSKLHRLMHQIAPQSWRRSRRRRRKRQSVTPRPTRTLHFPE